MIRGDEENDEFDYHEAFAPMAKMVYVRCFLLVAVTKGWELYIIDVNNSFFRWRPR